MKTDQLVDMLARQSGPAPRRMVEGRLAAAAAGGALASVAATLATLGLNPALSNMGGALAIKLAYVTCLLLGAACLAERASRPGVSLHRAAWSLALVILTMTAFAAAVVTLAPEDTRGELLFGRSWTSCPWRVASLSLPALAAMLWAARGLAPTRLRLAGFAAGAVAGSLGALGYALYCPELSPLFVLVWYSLGILVPALIGAALGPRLLRW
jgi:hypothetical protein